LAHMTYGKLAAAALLAGSLLILIAATASRAGTVPAGTVPAKEGEPCGTIQGIPCAEGLWCDPREGMCNGRDLDGVCVKPADTCSDELKPVCGCDRRTYGNDCKRIQAQVQLDHSGECAVERDQDKPASR